MDNGTSLWTLWNDSLLEPQGFINDSSPFYPICKFMQENIC